MLLSSRSRTFAVLVTLCINVNFSLASCPFSPHNNNFLPTADQNVGDNCEQRQHECDPNSFYYSYDGSCNNLEFTSWGEATTPYARLVAATYSDGVCNLRIGSDGNPLPPARKIRTTVLTDLERPSNFYNNLFNGFGQWFTHDATRSQPATSTEKCCTGENPTATDVCLPLIIPENDQFYSQFNVTCIEQTRLVNTQTRGCQISPCLPINFQTGLLDLSVLYGPDEDTVKKLRSFNNGELLVTKGQLSSRMNSFPPITSSDSTTCPAGGLDANSCMVTGDPRINLNPELTVTEVIFLRAHNRIAAILQENHPTWDDERLFQEARRLLIAFYKQIAFAELIPAYTGFSLAEKYNLLPARRGHIAGYDSNLNPQTILEYAFAAGRSHHSMSRGRVRFESSEGDLTSYKLRDKYFNQKFILEGDTFSNLMKGYMLQNSNRQSRHFSEDVTNFLFRAQNADFGSDLPAIDINRGLDTGIPPYNEVRQACGLRRFTRYRDLAREIMDPRVALKLRSLYPSIDDIDVYVGGLLEKPIKGALVGPTFACIIAEASYRWKFGDRLHYEFRGAKFSPAQLKTIRGLTFAHLLCLANPEMESVLKRAFLSPSKANRLIPCDELPEIDFSVF